MPWSGAVWVKRAWIGGLCLSLPMLPMVLAEITFLTPMLCIYLFAAGPVFGLAARQASCLACGYAHVATPTPVGEVLRGIFGGSPPR